MIIQYTITTVNTYYEYKGTEVYRDKTEFKKDLSNLIGKPVYTGGHFKPVLTIGEIETAEFDGNRLLATIKLYNSLYSKLLTGFSIGFYTHLKMDKDKGLMFTNIKYDHLLITNTPRCGAVCTI